MKHSLLTAAYRDARNAGVSDAPSVAVLVGMPVSDILWLEHLGVFPSSHCHHIRGRCWLTFEVAEWISAVSAPGVREWVCSLLPSTANSTVSLSKCIGGDNAR